MLLIYRVSNLLRIMTCINYKKRTLFAEDLLKLNFRIQKSSFKGFCGSLGRKNYFRKLEKFDRYSSNVCHVSVDAVARDNQGASRTWPDCREVFSTRRNVKWSTFHLISQLGTLTRTTWDHLKCFFWKDFAAV